MSRIERVNELIKEEVSQILLRELDIEAGVLVTIMEVETSVDLRQAKVLYSVFPPEKRQVVENKIKKNIYDIQQVLNKRLNMHPVPKLVFDPVSNLAQKILE